MKRIFTVWKKELKDTIRDRRTLMSMIVMPMVLMPALLLGMGKFTESQQRKIETQTVKVASSADSGPFLDYLRSQEKIEVTIVGLKDPAEVIKSGANIYLVFPNYYREQLDSSKPVALEAYRDSTVVSSANGLARINAAIAGYNAQIVNQRIVDKGVDPAVLNGFNLVPKDTATEQQRGGFGLGLLLPLFIVMWSVIGGQYTAIDVSAGEKERKTLESLLLTPVRRLELVLGKFLAVSTAAIISVVISLSSFYAAIVFGYGRLLSASAGGSQGAAASFSIGFGTVFLLFIVSVLLVLMFSSILLSIGIFAKNFKEAQSYIGPAYLVIVLPITILNIMPNFKPAAWFFILPVANALALFKELLIGVTDWTHVSLTLASLILYSAGAIYATTRIYQQEKVLITD